MFHKEWGISTEGIKWWAQYYTLHESDDISKSVLKRFEINN